MLCQHCLSQPRCLPYQLAKSDPYLLAFLEKLKRCEVYQPTPNYSL